MSSIRTRLATATAVIVLALQSVLGASAAPACGGRDVLAEMSGNDPAAHRAIMDKAAKVPNAAALLWKVEKPGKAPSYLFGTIHMTDERVTELSAPVVSALGAAKRVALELADMSIDSMKSAMAQSAGMLINPAGNGLERHLNPADMRTLQATLSKAGLPPQFSGLIRPWVVHMLLSLSECEQARGASGIKVVDMRIGDAARANGAEVTGLETVESQLTALASVPEPQQIELVKMSLRLSPRLDDMMETMVLMYTRRQMGAAWPLSIAMAEKAGVPASAFAGFETEILTKRNVKMRDRALPLLDQGATFVAVGALHLQGPAGLVDLIRKEGYTVTAVE